VRSIVSEEVWFRALDTTSCKALAGWEGCVSLQMASISAAFDNPRGPAPARAQNSVLTRWPEKARLRQRAVSSRRNMGSTFIVYLNKRVQLLPGTRQAQTTVSLGLV